MNNQIQEKKGMFFLLLGLFFLLLIVLYFFLYQPLVNELKVKENQVRTTKNEVDILNVRSEKATTKDDSNLEQLRLQTKLPMSRELESLILTLEEIEAVSNSRVENISFSYDGSMPESTTEGENEATEEAENEVTESLIDLEEKPENLHVITISMSVTSPNYDDFQTFIKEIEKQKRMMAVSQLEFEKPAESELLLEKDPDESIILNVAITTFYYEEQ